MTSLRITSVGVEGLIYAVPTTFKDGTTVWEGIHEEMRGCIAQAEDADEAIQRCRELSVAYRASCERKGIEPSPRGRYTSYLDTFSATPTPTGEEA